MKKLLFLFLAVASAGFAQTAKNRAALYTDIANYFPTTGAQQITAATARTFLDELAASTYNPLTDGAVQPLITTGSTAQYFRGDLSLATFPTTWAWANLSGVPTTADGFGITNGSQLDTMAANGSAFYLNSSNQNAGTLPIARLPSAVGLLYYQTFSSSTTGSAPYNSYGFTGSSSANLTLPLSTGFAPGSTLTIFDAGGNASGSVAIGYLPQGSDQLNGATATLTITTARGAAVLKTDGAGHWYTLGFGTAGGGGSGTSLAIAITQSNSFTVGQWVGFNGTSWVLAEANSGGVQAIGVVSVASGSAFTYVPSGLVTGLSGLTAGQNYWLSDATAGLGVVTASEPTAATSTLQYLGVAISSSSMLVSVDTPASLSLIPVSAGGTGVATLTGLAKGNGTSAFTAAVSGTDYAPATSGSTLLAGNGAGGFTQVSSLVGATYSAGTLTITANGSALTQTVTQTNSFTLGQAVYYTGSTWALSEANALSTSQVHGVVTATGNPFTVTLLGQTTALSLTANSVYYLSDSTAGLLTTTAPTAAASYVVQVLTTGGTAQAYVNPSNPASLALIPATAIQQTGSTQTTTYTLGTTATDYDVVFTGTANTTWTMPSSPTANQAYRIKNATTTAGVQLTLSSSANFFTNVSSGTLILNPGDSADLVYVNSTWQVQ